MSDDTPRGRTHAGRTLGLGDFARPSPDTIKLQASRTGRVCQLDSCTTKLAWTNPGNYCNLHEAEHEPRRNWHAKGLRA